MPADQSLEIARRIKERYCYIAADMAKVCLTVHVLSEVSNPISLQRLHLNSKLCADSGSEANSACAQGCIKAQVIAAASESQAACSTRGKEVMLVLPLQVEAPLMHSHVCCTPL